MTECIDLTKGKNLKPISFERFLKSSGEVISTCRHPADCEKIALLLRGYFDGMDLMISYKKAEIKGWLYIGYWNDGVVEENE